MAAAERLRTPPAHAAIGVLLAAWGVAVMAGWALRLPSIVDLIPGYRMVFSTAAAFGVAGCALLAEASAPGRRDSVQRGLGASLAVLGALVLLEHALDRDLGLDLRALHDWLPATSARPGRMAVPTALGFLLCGIAWLTLERAPALARALVVATGAIGVAALAGNALNLGALFPSYVFTQVAYPTAAGLALLALGLWGSAAGRAGYRPPWREDGARIRAVVAIVVLASGALAAVAGFAIMQRAAEANLRAQLGEDLATRAALVERELAQRRLAAQALALQPDIHRLLRLVPRDARAALELQRHVAAQLQFEFIALVLLDAAGREIASAGALARRAALRHELGGDAALVWSSGFELESRVAVIDTGERLGELRLNQPLREMTPAARQGHVLAFCARDGETVRCFPGVGAAMAYMTSLVQAPAPMRAALAGERGVRRGSDLRGSDVIVAYAPLEALGLGMALQVETATLFGALRPQIAWLTVLLAALAGGLLLVLRSQLAPLVQRLARSEDRLRRALEGSRLALWEADARSGTIHFSAEWNAMRGGQSGETQTTLAELFGAVPPEDAESVSAHLRRVLKGEVSHYDVEHRVRRLDDQGWIWVRARGKVVERDARGRALRVVGTNADITARKESELAAVRDAMHDALTGLANRRLFSDRLDQARVRAQRSGEALAVLYLDVDRFKPVNDAYGHAAGDELLKVIAARIAACLRASDTAARLGGDEFAVVLEGLGDSADARLVAEKIVLAMRAPFRVTGRSLQVSASIGVAVLSPDDAMRPEALLERADAALYEAKHAGRDRYALAA